MSSLSMLAVLQLLNLWLYGHKNDASFTNGGEAISCFQVLSASQVIVAHLCAPIKVRDVFKAILYILHADIMTICFFFFLSQ